MSCWSPYATQCSRTELHAALLIEQVTIVRRAQLSLGTLTATSNGFDPAVSAAFDIQ
jgi:hypothetical protein